MLLFFVFGMILYFARKPLVMCLSCCPRLQNKLDSGISKLKFNGLIRLVHESYLIVLISVILSSYQIVTYEEFDPIQSSLAVLLGLIYLGYPLFSLILIRSNSKELESRAFKEKYGSMIEALNEKS